MLGKKWLKGAALCFLSLVAIVFIVFITSKPTFSYNYHKLTERVKIGLEYTDPAKQTIYLQPYIENPNAASNMTLKTNENFITVCVLNESRKVLTHAVKVEQQAGKPTNGLINTTLGPGEKEKNQSYYAIELPDDAKYIQLEFSGKIEDEFGTASIDKMIEVNVNHLTAI
ncbi:hypothetical protein [Bacillus piscicola]|uniref:hypothetical protein n=1 Tax=Bacillus piscicola TaxID=1632684 RepID=UPI001F088BF7|nr:hypothetical protein [Bacillus piscicola]